MSDEGWQLVKQRSAELNRALKEKYIYDQEHPNLDLIKPPKKKRRKNRRDNCLPLSKLGVKIEPRSERPHNYNHRDALMGCKICGKGPGFYIHNILPSPRWHRVDFENKMYQELKQYREQRHSSFSRKVIRRRKAS